MKIVLIGILVLLLSGCKNHHSNTENLRNDLIRTIKKNYKLDHGDIIAKYDLGGINQGNCSIAKNYLRIINDENYHNLFLKKFASRFKNRKNSEFLQTNASKKTTRLINLISRLNDKYNYLKSKDLNFIKSLKEYKFIQNHKSLKEQSGSNKDNSMKDLANLDHLIGNLPILMPQNNIKITSHYGMRKHPISKRKKLHCGIDLVGAKSTPIYAAASGKVIQVSRQGGYGNLIEIEHGRNFRTRYAHLKAVLVSAGEIVLDGQKIGLQGNTGRTTAEHLHFEILFKNRAIDPYDFISHGLNC